MCNEAQKVQFGTHMLVEEADDWLENKRQGLQAIKSLVLYSQENFGAVISRGCAWEERDRVSGAKTREI